MRIKSQGKALPSPFVFHGYIYSDMFLSCKPFIGNKDTTGCRNLDAQMVCNHIVQYDASMHCEEWDDSHGKTQKNMNQAMFLPHQILGSLFGAGKLNLIAGDKVPGFQHTCPCQPRLKFDKLIVIQSCC